jgi:hypothetical protein
VTPPGGGNFSQQGFAFRIKDDAPRRKLNAGHLRRFEGIKLLISTANLNALG